MTEIRKQQNIEWKMKGKKENQINFYCHCFIVRLISRERMNEGRDMIEVGGWKFHGESLQ